VFKQLMKKDKNKNKSGANGLSPCV
jgi:hypothetical protein